MEKCMSCGYCQKRWDKNQYGQYVRGYYGCHCPPHWGKDIETIEKCPKEFEQKDIDAVAIQLNGR